MGTTGHKSEASIHSYAKKCPAMKGRQMSDALATDFIKKPKTPKKQATSTASVPAPEESNQNDTDPSIVIF